VVASNLIDEDVTFTGDLVWLYGVLSQVEDQAAFLTRLTALADGPAAQIYIYHYNAGSLRQFTIETCRSVLTYESESTFRADSALFVRPARMRARDDLTAPHVEFSTAADMRDLLRRCGIYITRQDRDFQHFLLGAATEEFCPHQFLCSLRPEDEVEIIEPAVPYAKEVDVLREIAHDLLALPMSPPQRKKLAVGLFNTHFAFIRDGVQAHDSVIELCLFLLYALLDNGVDEEGLSPGSAPYYAAFRAALVGADRSEKMRLFSGVAEDNVLTEYLVGNNLRA
jgi:hypothetical protein